MAAQALKASESTTTIFGNETQIPTD
jgi:hypothetical protein